ncbi:MAG: thiamine pyrophosphate-binding protein [Candidatus Methanoperedens sp.]|nr:thiamine pyrophosphate-binding protein [Candidatus Methanoperedens sp.]
MKKNLTIGEYLLEAIKELGITSVFGIPGDMVIRFFKVIEDDPDLDIYTFSHEPGVGFAAIGSARATQKPAVAVVTFGVGGLNMLNSVACAYAEKTPLIIISGAPGENEKIKGDLLHHTIKNFTSQLNIFREVTVEAVLLDSPKTAYMKIQNALSACSEFMLPVYIELPRDMVDEKIFIPEEKEALFYPINSGAIKEASEEILQRISNAKRPVILAGVETERFKLNTSVISLAERLNIPLVTAFLARDIIPNEHPLYYGTYVGLAGNKVAMELVEGSDCLLMLGVIIADANLGIKIKKLKQESMILSVSRQVQIQNHIYHDVPLKMLMEELLRNKLEKCTLDLPKKQDVVINRSCKLTVSSITTGEMIDAINWFFSEYGQMPIVSDTGDCLFTTLSINAPMVMASAYYCTMGFGAPAAIGYMLTTGQRPLVLIGDGAFQMTGQEICHCPRFGINPIFIIFNNKRWGMQQLFDPTAGFNELDNWPYSRIAELWGGKGYLCDTCEKLYKAFEDAKDDKEFSLIEVILEKDELSEELLGWVKELRG